MLAPSRGTRPRNRRQLIIAAAAELFATKGYPHVGMSDIASAVAIGPSALYRHFSGKQELLFEAVLSAMTSVRLDSFGSIADWVLTNRGLGVLWQRESRHLDPAARAKLRDELVGLQRQAAALIRRPVADAERDLLGWATMGALMSVSFQRIRLPAREFRELLVTIAQDVAATRLPVSRLDPPSTSDTTAPSTRDAVLAAAIRQFAARGYHSVGIEEIGAAAGIAGPSIYHHFASKVDLLVAGMNVGAAELRARMAAASGLGEVLGSYVDYSLAHSDVLDLLIAELDHLPDERRGPLRAAQRAYVAEWSRLMAEVHPHLPSAHARVRIQAALTVTNDLARTRHLSSRPGIAAETRAVGERILRL